MLLKNFCFPLLFLFTLSSCSTKETKKNEPLVELKTIKEEKKLVPEKSISEPEEIFIIRDTNTYKFSLPYHLYTDGNDWAQIDLRIGQDSLTELKVIFHPQEINKNPQEIILTGTADLADSSITIKFDKNYPDLKDFFNPEDSDNNFVFLNDSTIQFDKMVDKIVIMLGSCYNWKI